MERCVSLTVSALEGLKKEDVLNKTKKGPQLQEIIQCTLQLPEVHMFIGITRFVRNVWAHVTFH